MSDERYIVRYRHGDRIPDGPHFKIHEDGTYSDWRFFHSANALEGWIFRQFVRKKTGRINEIFNLNEVFRIEKVDMEAFLPSEEEIQKQVDFVVNKAKSEGFATHMTLNNLHVSRRHKGAPISYQDAVEAAEFLSNYAEKLKKKGLHTPETLEEVMKSIQEDSA